MQTGPLIIWQKWADPFGSEDIDTELDEFDPYTGNYNDESDTDHNHQDIKYDNLIQQKHQTIKVIATPMGIIPINENTASGKIFNFWIGHSNFDLSKKIVQIIEKTEGVETLDIFTRYRFRIAIGKVFDDSEVMRNINKKVYREFNNA